MRALLHRRQSVRALWGLVLLLVLAACARSPSAPATLTVLAAASLIDPFNEIGALFEAEHPGVSVVFNYAGSQQLAQQIGRGSPGDVFASASRRYVDAVLQSGRAAPGSERLLCANRLVVIYPAGNLGQLSSLPDLARPGLKLILAAPEVPAGQYSLDFLARAAQDPAFPPSFQADVLRGVVSYESNVRSVVTKVALGEADAGIVYASDAGAAASKALGRLEIPPALNPPVEYWIAPLAGSPQPGLAQAFVDLARSPAGQEILARYGFIVTPATY